MSISKRVEERERATKEGKAECKTCLDSLFFFVLEKRKEAGGGGGLGGRERGGGGGGWRGGLYLCEIREMSCASLSSSLMNHNMIYKQQLIGFSFVFG